MRRALVSLVALAFACGLQPALAQAPSIPGEPNWRLTEFPLGATTVTVDVVDMGSGVQVANDQATTQVQLDSTNIRTWKINLAALPGYPVNCEPATWLVRFRPDAADCVVSPSLCAADIVDLGGYLCKANSSVQVSYVYANGVASGQGITQPVMDFFNRRAQLPIKWREVRVAANEDFTTPDYTWWEVYFYGTDEGLPKLLCTVKTSTNPQSALPSSGACTGAP
jgi:hypothetical protein